MAEFTTPKVFINANGWGPTESNLPEQFVDLPYAPFGKNDRLGRAADFTAPIFYQNRQFRGKRGEESTINEQFQYKYDKEDDAQFALVDTSKSAPSKGKYSASKNRWSQAKGRGAGREQAKGKAQEQKPAAPVQLRSSKDRARLQPQGKKKWNALRKNDRKPWQKRFPRNDRQASVKVMADWQILEEIDLSQLSKLSAPLPKVTDLKWCGFLDSYDDKYEHISVKNSKKLKRHENIEFYYVTTMDDPVIEGLAVEPKYAGTVFATDAILSHLMTAPRSVFPWDVVIQKVNDSMFIDKRDNSQFDFLTVNETSFDVPVPTEDPDNINNPDKLSLEATMINQNFSQQILKQDKRVNLEFPNPFFYEDENGAAGTQPASVAYRYRHFNFGPELDIVARCEIHGYVMKREEKLHMTAFTLNEWDSKLAGTDEWRQKIDSQRGAVLATELKNNAAKMAKWIAQSILAGADQMKLGFVSRLTKANAYEHVILGTQFYKPTDFARQISLDQKHMWGAVKEIVSIIRRQKGDGKFVVMRDPNKAVLRIYGVPPNTFEDDEENEGIAEEEEEEED